MPPSDGVVPEFSRNNNRASRDRGAPTQEWVEELFIDYRADPVHGGPGPNPTVESERFSLTQGGIRWPDGAVGYEIDDNNAPVGGTAAIVAAVGIWDGFMPNHSFTTDFITVNPCTESASIVRWRTIDTATGPILATASVCRNVATKAIAGFVIEIDKDEPWSTDGSPTSTEVDVQNVISHEFGHVSGLDHVNAPRDGCLTMYKFAPLGETRKRTLGKGDKLGMKALYGSTDVSAGSCP